jgi:pSer/pThr/pTyr-binding forkhead associated (FHA) protein
LSIGFHAETNAPREVALPPLDARLEGLGRSFPIARALFALGRAPECDVPLDHEAVAGLHAQILRRDNALYLRDAGSRTGTWLNDRLLVSSEALFDGDRVRIGPAELVLRAPALRRSESPRADTITSELELEVRSGRSMGLSFALRGAGMLIGSAPGSSVELPELSVAPQHARVRKAGDQVFVSDLGSGYGTWLGGAPLAPGGEAELTPGVWLRVGAVDLVLVRGSVVRAAALRPRARLRVDAGPGVGTSVELGERTLVGSANTATLSLAGLAAAHLELLLHNGVFWARDLAGGGSFRSGSPLSGEFVELRNGDLLLLGPNTRLSFEEVP